MWSGTGAQSKESLWDAAGYGSLGEGHLPGAELSLDPQSLPLGADHESLISGVSDHLFFGSNPRSLAGSSQEKAPGRTGLSRVWGVFGEQMMTPLTPTCWASWGNSWLLRLLASKASATSMVQ